MTATPSGAIRCSIAWCDWSRQLIISGITDVTQTFSGAVRLSALRAVIHELYLVSFRSIAPRTTDKSYPSRLFRPIRLGQSVLTQPVWQTIVLRIPLRDVSPWRIRTSYRTANGCGSVGARTRLVDVPLCNIREQGSVAESTFSLCRSQDGKSCDGEVVIWPHREGPRKMPGN